MNFRKKALTLLQLTTTASAACGTTLASVGSIETQLSTMGYPIAWFMMAYLGAKWVTSEDPEGRENSRRGCIYIVIGVVMLRSATTLTDYLFC